MTGVQTCALPIFISALTIFSLFVLATFFYQYSREKAFRHQQLNDILQTYNYTILNAIENNNVKIDSLNKLVEFLSPDPMRVTLMDHKGNIITDNSYDSIGIFENHQHRPEIIEALTNGKGYALRYSESLGDSFFYSALKSDNYIIRSALPFNLKTLTYLKIDKGIISFFVILFIAFFVMIFYFTYRLGTAISTLREFSQKAENNENIDLNINVPNNDIGDITKHIIRLYNKLKGAKQQIATEKDKLIKHLQISKEGLGVFNFDRKPIFTNSLFIQYINLISDKEISQPQQVIFIPEFEKIRSFLFINQNEKQANIEYLSESVTINKNSMIFIAECIIFQDRSFEISINNITQAQEETKLKRQLTQNIAHELKTPVSSIRGYLETLVTNNNIDEKTRNGFIEKCYAQSNRLTGLLQDISVLNRIDEASTQFDMEPLNLFELVEDIVLESEPILKEKDMNVILSIQNNCNVLGNHSLIYSIFRNLMDNSLAYAGNGKTINIKCYLEDDNSYYFSFSDNGPGVNEEHLNRLFERFYRVDKGRSRKLGGTGLGLAIVKNSIILHKGKIMAKNRMNGGLEFIFSDRKSVV